MYHHATSMAPSQLRLIHSLVNLSALGLKTLLCCWQTSQHWKGSHYWFLWVSAMVELIAVTEKRPRADIIVHPSCSEYQCTRAWCYGGKLRPSRVLHLKSSLIEQISHPIVSSFLLVSFFSGYKWRLRWHQRNLPSWSLSKVISVFMCFQSLEVGNPPTHHPVATWAPCAQRRCWPLRHRLPLSWPQPLAPLIRWCLIKLQHAWKIQIKPICTYLSERDFYPKRPGAFGDFQQ